MKCHVTDVVLTGFWNAVSPNISTHRRNAGRNRRNRGVEAGDEWLEITDAGEELRVVCREMIGG